MPVVGIVSGLPSNQFAFPRNYLAGAVLKFGDNAIITWFSDHVEFVDGNNPFVHGRFGWAVPWTAASSNRYTLTFLCNEAWYQIDPSPTQYPLNVQISWFPDPATRRNWVLFDAFTGGSTLYYHPLPQPPQPWLPPPA